MNLATFFIDFASNICVRTREKQMKSLAIIGAVCFLFITISGFIQNPKLLISSTKSVQCDSKTCTNKPLILERKTLKTKQMPNWQRVIPGMFR